MNPSTILRLSQKKKFRLSRNWLKKLPYTPLREFLVRTLSDRGEWQLSNSAMWPMAQSKLKILSEKHLIPSQKHQLLSWIHFLNEKLKFKKCTCDFLFNTSYSVWTWGELRRCLGEGMRWFSGMIWSWEWVMGHIAEFINSHSPGSGNEAEAHTDNSSNPSAGSKASKDGKDPTGSNTQTARKRKKKSASPDANENTRGKSKVKLPKKG